VDPVKAFADAVEAPEPEINLAQACLLIAKHVHADLDVGAQLRRLDAMAVRSPSTLDGMIKYLFADLGFRGNSEDYDDPGNSLLDEVLDRRTGLPITLSIVTMEVGQRVGLPIVGIGMPAHFLVRHEATPQVYIDPFYGGEILDEAGCRARLAQLLGSDVPFDPTWFQPAAKRDILARVLSNLKRVYSGRTQWRNLEWVCRARLAIPGMGVVERAELGRAIAAQGRYREASEELSRASDEASDEEEKRKFQSEAVTLRARLN
jgi:regulator of sirC expression with transglutaminase-like and TPR domain